MKIVYLDQFIVSDLADSSDHEWVEIREIFKELAKDGKICCPLSTEHYLESSSRSSEEAVRNDELLNTLSLGKCFYQEFYITTTLINAFVKDQPFIIDMYISTAIENIFRDRKRIERFKVAHAKYRDIIEANQSLTNEIRTITRGDKMESSLRSSMFQVAKGIPARTFVERMEKLFKEGKMVIRGEMTPHGEIPNWIDIILEYLLRHFKFESQELLHLFKEINENGFDNIPTLDIISCLRAYQTVFQKKVTANDEIDNLRIACGLPISDLLLTDKKRKFEILEMGLDSKYNCLVLCGNREDRIELKKYLNNLKL